MSSPAFFVESKFFSIWGPPHGKVVGFLRKLKAVVNSYFPRNRSYFLCDSIDN